LLQVRLKRGIGLLRGLKISGLQGLQQLVERLRNRIGLLRGGRILRAFHVVMVVVMPSDLPRNLLHVLLDICEVLLRRL
jgi:hypothetical protein